jgi:hypothetical protein
LSSGKNLIIEYKARIKNQNPGDVVTYWIKKGNEQLGPYTYTVDKSGDNPVLIVAAEDYPGVNPEYPDPTAPNYLSYYTDALDTLGIGYDIWDVDAEAAAPPVDAVLSHYKVVIWYSGDDFAPELNGFHILADEYVAVREYLNYYRGRVFATGQDLSWLATQFGLVPGTSEAMSDDFFQYYLGAYIDVDTGGIDDAGLPFDVVGIPGDPIFDGLSFSLQGGDGANNQVASSSFLPTSQFLPNFTNNTLAAK